MRFRRRLLHSWVSSVILAGEPRFQKTIGVPFIIQLVNVIIFPVLYWGPVHLKNSEIGAILSRYASCMDEPARMPRETF
jgi:hypothetical protein